MIRVSLKPGKYIVAVSGGVDSVVLLDILAALPAVDLIVAHVDHGIRSDSHLDAALVEKLAQKYQLKYESIRLDLQGRTDEESARRARHDRLETVRQKYGADMIATAHHNDDVVETILINLLRGTGWRGLASLRKTDRYERPLLNVTKADIVRHAIENNLSWHEDTTNEDMRYLRNYIRRAMVPRLTLDQIGELRALYEKQCKIRQMIEADNEQILELATEGEDALSRYWLIMTPDNVARELLRLKYGAMTRDQLSRLLAFARTAPRDAKLEISKLRKFRVTPRQLVVWDR